MATIHPIGRRTGDSEAGSLLRSYLFFLPVLSLVLLAWVFGWEFIYRPLPLGPVISPYTASLFIVLILLHGQTRVALPHIEIDEHSARKHVARYFLSTTLLVMLGYGLWLNMRNEIPLVFGFPGTSTPTLLTLSAFACYEFLRGSLKQPSLLVDLTLLPSIVWIYLSLLGNATGKLYLTGALAGDDYGLSLPTVLFCIAYLAMVLTQDRLSLSGSLFRSVPWIRRAILWVGSIQLVTPLLFVLLLENFFPPIEENRSELFFIMTLFLLLMLAIYTVFLVQLSLTHNRLQTMCSYTHKFKTDGGDWQSLEQFLAENYGLKISHGISMSAIPRTEKELERKQGNTDQLAN